MCEMMTAPTDTALVGFRFLESDSILMRKTAVAFKPTGKPIYAVIYVQATGRDDSTDASGARVDFFRSKGMRFDSRGDGPDTLLPQQKDADGRLLPLGATALSASDMERARALMDWYWAHGCRAHTGSATAAPK